MNILQNNFSSIEQMAGQIFTPIKNSKVHENSDSKVSFQEVFKKNQEIRLEGELRFSKHASERIASRNIDLSSSQLKRLEDGAKKAQEKGINESLIMVDDFAFIINVKSNTVITAVDESDDKIFTNIDGAVII